MNTVLHTHDGYLWIGTVEGLVRFNSTQFTTFSNGDTPVMKAQDIRALFEDRARTLWVGTFGGRPYSVQKGVLIPHDGREGLDSLFIGDVEGIERAAHKIKGSVSIFTVPPVTQAAFDLEMRGRNRDLKDIDLAFAKLKNQIEELVLALSDLRQQLCPQPS